MCVAGGGPYQRLLVPSTWCAAGVRVRGRGTLDRQWQPVGLAARPSWFAPPLGAPPRPLTGDEIAEVRKYWHPTSEGDDGNNGD